MQEWVKYRKTAINIEIIHVSIQNHLTLKFEGLAVSSDGEDMTSRTLKCSTGV